MELTPVTILVIRAYIVLPILAYGGIIYSSMDKRNKGEKVTHREGTLLDMGYVIQTIFLFIVSVSITIPLSTAIIKILMTL